jgi:hypothetical protein
LIAVLISLVQPALRAARDSARELRTLSDLRSHAAVFAMYTGDWRDTFPYFVDPEQPMAAFQDPRAPIQYPYFQSYTLWNIALADWYYEGAYAHGSFYPPGSRSARPDIHGTWYYYGCVFIARPEYWSFGTHLGPEQWRPTKRSEVAYPAHKALLTAYYPLSERLPSPVPPVSGAPRLLPAPIGFVDGSAEAVRLRHVREGFLLGDGPYPGMLHTVDVPYTLHTIDGVRGRDVGSRR